MSLSSLIDGRFYDDASLTEHARSRPGLYIGRLEEDYGLRAMLWEVVNWALHGHRLGLLSRIVVGLRADGAAIDIAHDGCDWGWEMLGTGGWYHRWFNMPLIFSSRGAYEEVRPGRLVRRFGFSRGEVFDEGALESECPIKKTMEEGVRLSFTLDPQIFPANPVNRPRIARRMRELAYFHPEAQLVFDGEPLDGGDGLRSFCESLAPARTWRDGGPLRARGAHPGAEADIAFGWVHRRRPVLRSFVNRYRCRQYGSHVVGFWCGLRRGLASSLRPEKLWSLPSLRRALCPGLRAVVNVNLASPRFNSSTKDLLATPLARVVCRDAVADALPAHLEANPTLLAELRRRLP